MSEPTVINCDYVNAIPAITRGVWKIVLEIPAEAMEDFLQSFHLPTPSTRRRVALANVDANLLSINEKKEEAHNTLRQQLIDSVEQETEKVKGGRLAKRAGILCHEPAFRRFLAQDCEGILMFDIDMAIEELRTRCGVKSRAELDHNPEAAAKFHAIDSAYTAWMTA